MIKDIPISEELRDYIERLNFEEIRYQDLINCVSRENCDMTDEEWTSSLEYYQNLAQEAKLCKSLALKEIYEIYKDEIQDQPWHINFPKRQIVVGTIEAERVKDKIEAYQDYLTRLFPEPTITEMAMNSPHVKDITLQVTDACNMACTYCYQHNKGKHSMSFETAKHFLSMILDADELTNTYITSTKSIGAIINFIGGEPWLEIDLITKVTDWFMAELFRRKHRWAIKFMIGICSNGLLHFDPRVQDYLKKHMKHISYSISIDGSKELHDSCRVDLAGNGTYERAIKAVYNYRDVLGGTMGSKMTIAPGNVDKIFDCVTQMIEESGYRNINLNCVYEEGWTNEHANILYWELHRLVDWIFEKGLEKEVRLSILDKEHGKPNSEKDNQNWCGGTGLMIAVDYKGDIYPCLRYMESSVNNKVEPFIIGDLENGINRKEEHSNRIKCLSCVSRHSQSTDECYNCPIGRGCGWCSAYNYETYGTPNKRTTFICCMHKARSLAILYYQRRMGEDFPMYCPKEWAIEIIGEEEYEKLKNMEVAHSGEYNSE